MRRRIQLIYYSQAVGYFSQINGSFKKRNKRGDHEDEHDEMKKMKKNKKKQTGKKKKKKKKKKKEEEERGEGYGIFISFFRSFLTTKPVAIWLMLKMVNWALFLVIFSHGFRVLKENNQKIVGEGKSWNLPTLLPFNSVMTIFSVSSLFLHFIGSLPFPPMAQRWSMNYTSIQMREFHCQWFYYWNQTQLTGSSRSNDSIKYSAEPNECEIKRVQIVL